jgi:hypothetical protein
MAQKLADDRQAEPTAGTEAGKGVPKVVQANPHRKHLGRADPAPCPGRRLCPLRQPQENRLMERTQLFDLMGELKLYGMKAA